MKLWLMGLVLVFSACVHHVPKKDWNANDYKNNSNSQFIAAHRAMTRVHFKGNEKVLDIGCGDGKITAEIASSLGQGHVHGIDLSEAMIEFASKNFADRKNLKFSQMDAAEITFVEEFDVVVSFSALQWVLDQAKAFEGVHRSLKPQGSFLMMIPAGYPDPLRKALDEIMRDEKWRLHFKQFKMGQVFHSKEAYEKMLVEKGFADVKVELIPTFDRFESIDAFTNFVRQWLPHLTAIPKENHDAFMNDLMTRYEKRQGRERDGSIWFNKFSLEALAKKT